MDANIFLKLSKKRAQDKAESLNMIFRLIRIDEENFLSYPDDYRDDRVCVEVDGGVVSKATIR
jgi:hypothetical protein